MTCSHIGCMRQYNINANLLCNIEHLYNKAIISAFKRMAVGEWFQNSWSNARIPSLTSPPQHVFLKRIMSDVLEEQKRKFSIGDRTLTNQRFADAIDALVEETQKLVVLVEILDKTCKRYKMKISPEKIKLMTNSANAFKERSRYKARSRCMYKVKSTKA